MTSENLIEISGLNILFMDRGGYQPVNLFLFQGGHRSLKGEHGVFTAFVSQLTGGNLNIFFPAAKQVNLFMIDPGEIFNTAEAQVQFRQGLPVKVDHFIGSKNHGGAMFQDPVIRKSLNNQFNADAVYIAAGNADYWFIGIHVYLYLSDKSTIFKRIEIIQPGLVRL